eukprot:Gregarina_sp_Poly_1__2174@NODE_1578_length_3802_cov_127_223829_g1043_i0_p2_GENE_NODE_1578_length_3802_cov_127_223829_g1043_i0NODE_1578_length_3802_cov_127_223829_g1043_i0_p2_ORF_typecomplete_len397_score39_51_NODE_1578_length_3802_cov_127_223829_g1043_i04951685
MGREIQQKVKDLVLKEAARKYCSLDKRIASDVLTKAWGQFAYDRNVWGQTFRKISRDPRISIHECPEPQKALDFNCDSLYRFTEEQKEAVRILRLAQETGVTKLIPPDLSDEYVMNWIREAKVEYYIRNPHAIFTNLDSSLNVNNLQRALEHRGILLRTPKAEEKGHAAPFNLQAPGKSDTRWSEVVLNGRPLRVKRCRASLAVYHAPCPRICIFYVTADLTMILFYHGLQGHLHHLQRHSCGAAVNRSSGLLGTRDIAARSTSSQNNVKQDEVETPPMREIIPLQKLKHLWLALPQVQSLCKDTKWQAYLLAENDADIYLMFVDPNSNKIEEVSRWSLSTTMSLSCAAEAGEKPEPNDFISIEIKDSSSPLNSRKRRRTYDNWSNETCAIKCQEI